MAMVWKKISQVVGSEGRILAYGVKGYDNIRIESRKRRIPHSNGVGGWFYTSYFVVTEDGREIEKYTLKDAKTVAEKMILEVKE